MSMQRPGETQLQQVVGMLARRRTLILVAGLVGAALAGLIGLVLPAKFTAKAQLLIQSQPHAMVSGSGGRADVVDEMALESQAAMLTSHAHLRRVRSSLVAVFQRKGAQDYAQNAATSVGTALAAPAPNGPTAALGDVPTIEELELNSKVFKERQSRVVSITYTSTNPHKSAVIANQLARLFVEVQADRKREEKSSEWVERQITALNHQISFDKSDLAARQARIASLNDLRSREGGTDALIDALGSDALTEFRRDQVALTRQQSERTQAGSKEQPTAVKLQEFRNKIAAEADRIVKQQESELQTAATRVRALEQRLETLQSVRNQTPGGEERPRTLLAGATSSLRPYEALLVLQKGTPQQPEVSPGMRIISLADAPALPSSPNPILFVFPAVVLFAIAGGFLAVILEGLDRGLRSARDVEEALGVPCIGIVPAVASKGKNSLAARTQGAIARMQLSKLLTLAPGAESLLSALALKKGQTQVDIPLHNYMRQNLFSNYSEAIRAAVIATLQTSTPHRAPKVLLVTSSAPNEGKTTLAVSLATYAACLQRRVILIDLAFRRPAVWRELGGDAEDGILEALQGRPVEQVIKHIPDLALDYLPLPMHDASIDPLTLLDGARLGEILQQLRQSYDCVVIDGAEFVGGPEMRMLLALVDKVIFAVKWHSTPKEVAQHAVNLIRGACGRDKDAAGLVNAVVTQVDLEMHARYRYGDVPETPKRNWFAKLRKAPFPTA